MLHILRKIVDIIIVYVCNIKDMVYMLYKSLFTASVTKCHLNPGINLVELKNFRGVKL